MDKSPSAAGPTSPGRRNSAAVAPAPAERRGSVGGASPGPAERRGSITAPARRASAAGGGPAAARRASIAEATPTGLRAEFEALTNEEADPWDLLVVLERCARVANDSKVRAREGEDNWQPLAILQMARSGTCGALVQAMTIHIRNRLVCLQAMTTMWAMLGPKEVADAFLKAGVIYRLHTMQKHHRLDVGVVEKSSKLMTSFYRSSMYRIFRCLAPFRSGEAVPLGLWQWIIFSETTVEFEFYEEQRAHQLREKAREKQKQEKEAALKEAEANRGVRRSSLSTVTTASGRRASTTNAANNGSGSGSGSGSSGGANDKAERRASVSKRRASAVAVEVASSESADAALAVDEGGAGEGGAGANAPRRGSVIVGKDGVLTEARRMSQVVALPGAGVILDADVVKRALASCSDSPSTGKGKRRASVKGDGAGGGGGRRYEDESQPFAIPKGEAATSKRRASLPGVPSSP
jgi:hypothetical protein